MCWTLSITSWPTGALPGPFPSPTSSCAALTPWFGSPCTPAPSAADFTCYSSALSPGAAPAQLSPLRPSFHFSSAQRSLLSQLSSPRPKLGQAPPAAQERGTQPFPALVCLLSTPLQVSATEADATAPCSHVASAMTGRSVTAGGPGPQADLDVWGASTLTLASRARHSSVLVWSHPAWFSYARLRLQVKGTSKGHC